MPSDKELRDAAVAELKLTTAGWRKPNGNLNYPSGTAPASTHWGQAMSSLAQIAASTPNGDFRDAAVVELKLTTAGWRKPNGQPNYPSGTAPLSTHWGKAMDLLAQIGQSAPGTVYSVTQGDVQAQLAAIPSGTQANPSIVRFAPGTYLIASQVAVSGKQWWIVESGSALLGGDATLKWTIPVTLVNGMYQGDDSKRLLRFDDCANMTLRYLTLVGASPMPATGDGFKPWENVQHMHSLAVERCTNFTVQKLKIDGSGGGDAINWGNENYGTRSTGVIEDCDIRNAHRCTIALVGSGGLTIRRNTFARGGFWMIDLEPNTVESGNFNTVIEGNTFESQAGLLSRCAIGAFAGSKDGQGLCENVTITGNVFNRAPELRFNTDINGGYPYPKRIKNVRIENNTATIAGPQIECRQIDTLNVSGNNFSATSDPEFGLVDCTDYHISGSTYQVVVPPFSPILWGARMDGEVYGTGDAPWDSGTWDTFEQHAGKKVGLVEMGQPFGIHDTNAFNLIRARSAIAVLGMGIGSFTIEQIGSGAADATIDAWATKIGTQGHPCFFRPWWEMNGNWGYGWQTGAGVTAAEYITAWRRFRTRADAAGATNVTWVWCPNEFRAGGSVPDPAPWYPGDAYVDWMGFDGYGRGDPVATVYDPIYARLQALAPSKSIIVCETAAQESGTYKPGWISDVVARLQANYPAIKAWTWFNWNILQSGTRYTWPIESSPAAQAAFASGIASSYFRAQSPLLPLGTKVTIANPNNALPASYYTGPLRQQNILPKDPSGALLILWSGDVNMTLASWKTRVQERETACGRTFDGIGIHYGGGGTFGGVASCSYINPSEAKEQWIHDRGSVPIVSWSPNATIAQVNSGGWDACFTAVANYFKAYDFRIMLRLWWEFDGNWMNWKATVGQEAAWISAWRRVVGLFQAAGADNVGFWWCPTEGFNRTLASACYPGDAFVDWVGSDCYNQATPTVWTMPLRAGWGEFWELFNYTGHGTAIVSKHNEFGPRKPYVVGETGALYDSSNVSRKANWYRNIDSHAFALQNMPYLCGVQFFDVNLVTTEGFDWKVDNNQTYAQKQAKVDGQTDAATYQGFKDFAAAARWNVGVA